MQELITKTKQALLKAIEDGRPELINVLTLSLHTFYSISSTYKTEDK